LVLSWLDLSDSSAILCHQETEILEENLSVYQSMGVVFVSGQGNGMTFMALAMELSVNADLFNGFAEEI
jgi:hypothetical protein